MARCGPSSAVVAAEIDVRALGGGGRGHCGEPLVSDQDLEGPAQEIRMCADVVTAGGAGIAESDVTSRPPTSGLAWWWHWGARRGRSG